jgi:hypothetical protein
MEIHAADPLLLEPSPFEVELSIENPKRYNKLPAELIHAKDESHVLVSIKYLNSGTSLLVCLFTRKAIKLTVVIIEA